MSAPGRSQALIPEPFGGEGIPVSAPGRSQALMPEPFGGEGTPASEAAGGFEARTLALLAQAAARLTPPRIKALHLPPARPGDELAGESCALELAEGSIGLSCVLFGDTLPRLRAAAPELADQPVLEVAQGLAAPVAGGATAALHRTLGLAAANAMTCWLWRRAGWEPPPAEGPFGSLAGLEPQAGECFGMVGYFAPLRQRILAAGARLVVIELRRDLLGERDGVLVTDDPADLAACGQVLCTGTAVLNGTLTSLRQHAAAARRFALIGPSAGLLPDALFELGVTDLGGSWIRDGAAFVDALRCGEHRGAATRKFVLGRAAYPGLPALLARC